MTLVFIHYNNPELLKLQIAEWRQYPSDVKLVLVDDCSAAPPAVPSLRPDQVFELYRIDRDIPWNCAGARNLGCLYAQGWIAVSDLDTIWPANQLTNLLVQPLAKDCFYLPSRITNQGRPMRPSVSSLVFHRDVFDQVGGYDEDYAGHHGREDVDFFLRLKATARVVLLKDVVKRWIPPYALKGAATPGPRDDTRNKALLVAKRAAGFPRPLSPLRFPWHRLQ